MMHCAIFFSNWCVLVCKRHSFLGKSGISFLRTHTLVLGYAVCVCAEINPMSIFSNKMSTLLNANYKQDVNLILKMCDYKILRCTVCHVNPFNCSCF